MRRPAARGPKTAEPNPLAAELALSRRENLRLKQRLERAETIIELQKTYGPPRLQVILSRAPNGQSASTYPASGPSLGPRWRYARPGPHKSLGVERHFLNQVSGTPFDC